MWRKGSRIKDQLDGQQAEAASRNASSVVDLREYRQSRKALPITLHRRELDAVLPLYGGMVGEGEWRDYTIDHMKDKAVFSIFKHSGELPMFRIEKNPRLADKQGAFCVVKWPYLEARP